MASLVHVFPTCLMETFRPQAIEAVERVLQRAGVTPHRLRRATCCGQPAFNAGDWAAARRMARHTIEALEAHPGPIVVPSGSCTAMFRQHYPHLFAEDPAWLPRAQALARRTYEFTEYLVEGLGVTDLGAAFPHRVAYHPSCHLLRGLGVDRQPRALLARVRGLTMVDFPDAEACCGFGGVFSAEQPEIAQAMLHRKVEHMLSAAPDVVVAADLGCLLHLQAGLRQRQANVPALHIAEVLAFSDEVPLRREAP